MDTLSKEAREAKRQYQREYKKRNKERLAAYRRKYAAENPDKIRQYHVNYWENKALELKEQGEKGDNEAC